MDRRQRKSRDAIFKAFIELLSEKGYNQITVGEIIEIADVGRATFYSHFETKDFLLKELCEELFEHIFHSENGEKKESLFECNAPDSVFLHLFQHLQKNDNKILSLLSCHSNELFLRYFKENLAVLVKRNLHLFNKEKTRNLPEAFVVNHISSVFVESAKWWIDNGLKETPETMTEYFLSVV